MTASCYRGSQNLLNLVSLIGKYGAIVTLTLKSSFDRAMMPGRQP